MNLFNQVEITPYFNATAATGNQERRAGRLNAWGNSIPAEEVPFGSLFSVDGIPFRLPTAGGDRYDHMEALGQLITLRTPMVGTGIAFLCFGEMGRQDVELSIVYEDRATAITTIIAKAWLTDEEEVNSGFAFSHLHYPGDYELDMLRPILWTYRYEWQQPATLTQISIGENPLVHIFGITIIGSGKE